MPEDSLFDNQAGDRPVPPPEPQPPGVWTVSQLTRAIRGALRARFPATVSVLGEISDFKAHSSGHWYFSLKDAASELACVMWRSDNVRLRCLPESGLQLVARGELDVYERGGRYQMYVRTLQLQGTGDLELAFRQLCARLRAEGLFDATRKRPAPRIPEHLAVVTSPSGAAAQDIFRVLQRRFPCVRVTLCAVPVQGDGAAQDMAAMIDALNLRADIDTIILARGGGSLQDLWQFNEEALARAIFRSRIPIITGIGHEVDVTIADLVADVRAPTPSAAAEQAVPSGAELRDRLSNLQVLLQRLLRQHCRLAGQALAGLSQREPLRAPGHLIRGHRQHLDHLGSRLGQSRARLRLSGQSLASAGPALQAAMQDTLRRWAAVLDSLDKRLQGVSPQRTLQRGYTVTVDALSGGIIRRAAQVHPGQEVRTCTAEGTFESRVSEALSAQETHL